MRRQLDGVADAGGMDFDGLFERLVDEVVEESVDMRSLSANDLQQGQTLDESAAGVAVILIQDSDRGLVRNQ